MQRSSSAGVGVAVMVGVGVEVSTGVGVGVGVPVGVEVTPGVTVGQTFSYSVGSYPSGYGHAVADVAPVSTSVPTRIVIANRIFMAGIVAFGVISEPPLGATLVLGETIP